MHRKTEVHKQAREQVGVGVRYTSRSGVQRSGAALVLSVLSSFAVADDLSFTDYATIESVEPIVTRQRINEPVQECRPVRATSS